jgi:biotin carboxyl carrier protein
LFIVESMKTEISVSSPCDGQIHSLAAAENCPVAAGEHLAAILES